MTNPNLDTQLKKLRIEKERKRAKRGRARWLWTITLILTTCAIIYGLYAHVHAPVPVKTVRLEHEQTAPGQGPALVTASGYVVPRHKVEVSSKIIGRIKELYVRRGDKVQQGDILLRIEDDEYQARVRSCKALVATLTARLAELHAGSRPQEIEAAKAAVVSAEATLRSAQLDFERIDALARQGAVSKQELDRTRASRDVAQARLDADRKNAELVTIGPRKEQIEAAEAQLHEAEANLDAANTDLNYTIIRAPITGVILEKLAEQGELVTNTNFGGNRGAKNSVVTMADLTDLQVEIDLNETEVLKVKPKQKVEIHIDSNPQHPYKGEVDEVSPQADRQKGSVQVKTSITDPGESIKTEVNARVTFFGEPDPATSTHSNAGNRLWAPKPVVISRDEGPAVYLLDNGKAILKPIKLGVEGERGIEITEGLNGSETLILSPLEKLTDGTRVIAQ